MKKLLLILVVILLIAGGVYWWSFMRAPGPGNVTNPNQTPGSFNPFNRPGSTSTSTPQISPSSSSITSTPVTKPGELPHLRHLSLTPIGGFVASSTASSSIVRFVDRGAGHISQASSTSLEITKISNTTVPKVYESYWNRNANQAVFRYIKDSSGIVTNFFAGLQTVPRNASSTEPSTIPFEIKGKFLSSTIQELAVSPKGDRIATLNVESTGATINVSSFDENKKAKIIDSPITQVNLDWPEENTIILSTKPSSTASGYLYSIDLKKPSMKKLIGGVAGLTAKVSHDAKKVIYSGSSSRGLTTYLLNIADNSTQEVVFRTLADKCVWSVIHPTEAYCAVPTDFPAGVYPDDWYKGNVAFVDQIWHIDSVTGDVHLIANLLNLSDSLIDATDLALDPKENFLYFVNKRDLTLWSLDLN